MRPDLLALSDDDLTALSNRGTVKRARAEVDGGTPTFVIDETPDGAVTVRWSDDVVCELPGGVSLSRGRCSCPAEPPCRHLVRSAMAYRTHVARAPAQAVGATPLAKAELAPALVARARKLFDEGQLFELTRAEKPIARCHSIGVVTRFFVAEDPHHSVCDCGEPAPCEHAVMAVWAFERLAPDVQSGLVDTRSGGYPVPTNALDALEGVLVELARVGLADAPSPLIDRVRHVEAVCRKAGLAWVADGIDELVVLKAAYDARDARFDAARLCEVIGELVVRSDATRADRGVVPPLFVRGAAVDRPIAIASARLVGLGCAVRARRASYELTAFMQAEDTGQVTAVVRELSRGIGDTKPLSEAARSSVAKGITIADVSSGRTLLKGGRRSAGGVLSFGRAPAACQPQTYQWEKLRAPVLAEGFREITARLASLPPKPLRPRRLAEDLHVVPIAEVASVGFDSVEQSVKAALRDPEGGDARLVHPFHARAAAGADALLAALGGERVLFVAGRCRRDGPEVVVEPIGVIVEREGKRRLVQPWIEGAPSGGRTATPAGADTQPRARSFIGDELANAIGDLFVTGVEGMTPTAARLWRERARDAAALGFTALPPHLEALAARADAGRTLALAALVSFAAGA